MGAIKDIYDVILDMAGKAKKANVPRIDEDVARLKMHVEELERQHAKEASDLKKIISELKGENLTAEDHRALELLDSARGEYVSADAIAKHLSISGSRADCILRRLSEAKYAFEHATGKCFRILQKGSAIIHGPSG